MTGVFKTRDEEDEPVMQLNRYFFFFFFNPGFNVGQYESTQPRARLDYLFCTYRVTTPGPLTRFKVHAGRLTRKE